MNKNLPFDFTVVVLCGGESSRMKTDKGLVSFNGRPLILNILDIVEGITDKVILIANDKRYVKFGFPCYSDIYPGKGPMGGIYTGLNYSETKKNLVLSCDMPFMTTEFLSALVENAGDEEILVPVHDGVTEPLAAVYDLTCKIILHQNIIDGKLKLRDCLQEQKTRLFEVKKFYPKGDRIFTNINTPEELLKYEN